MENYGIKFGIILKISVNIADSFCVIFGPNCGDTSRPKFVDTPRPKCVYFSCEQYLYWEYQDILSQEIMYQDLL